MSRDGRSNFGAAARACSHARERFDQAMSRGDVDRATDSMAQMQTIEQCYIEVSGAWRRPEGQSCRAR